MHRQVSANDLESRVLIADQVSGQVDLGRGARAQQALAAVALGEFGKKWGQLGLSVSHHEGKCKTLSQECGVVGLDGKEMGD